MQRLQDLFMGSLDRAKFGQGKIGHDQVVEFYTEFGQQMTNCISTSPNKAHAWVFKKFFEFFMEVAGNIKTKRLVRVINENANYQQAIKISHHMQNIPEMPYDSQMISQF